MLFDFKRFELLESLKFDLKSDSAGLLQNFISKKLPLLLSEYKGSEDKVSDAKEAMLCLIAAYREEDLLNQKEVDQLMEFYYSV